MSADLYPIRVYFEGGSGVVRTPATGKWREIFRKISKAPEIPGLPKLSAIDYAPAVFAGTIQPWAGQRRDMTPAENAMVKTWLGFVAEGEDGPA